MIQMGNDEESFEEIQEKAIEKSDEFFDSVVFGGSKEERRSKRSEFEDVLEKAHRMVEED